MVTFASYFVGVIAFLKGPTCASFLVESCLCEIMFDMAMEIFLITLAKQTVLIGLKLLAPSEEIFNPNRMSFMRLYL